MQYLRKNVRVDAIQVNLSKDLIDFAEEQELNLFVDLDGETLEDGDWLVVSDDCLQVFPDDQFKKKFKIAEEQIKPM